MNNISKFRKSTNLTRQQFSTLLNISLGALGHYEVGRRQPPLKMAQKIIQVLNQHGANVRFEDIFPAEQEK